MPLSGVELAEAIEQDEPEALPQNFTIVKPGRRIKRKSRHRANVSSEIHRHTYCRQQRREARSKLRRYARYIRKHVPAEQRTIVQNELLARERSLDGMRFTATQRYAA